MLLSVLMKTWLLHTLCILVSRNVFVLKRKCLFYISVMLFYCCCWYWASTRPKCVDLPRKVHKYEIKPEIMIVNIFVQTSSYTNNVFWSVGHISDQSNCLIMSWKILVFNENKATLSVRNMLRPFQFFSCYVAPLSLVTCHRDIVELFLHKVIIYCLITALRSAPLKSTRLVRP